MLASVRHKGEPIAVPPSCLYFWPFALSPTELVASRSNFIKFFFVRFSSGPFMSNRVYYFYAQMLIVSAKGTAVNLLFMSKEHMYVFSFNVPSFVKFANVKESFTQ